MNQVARRRIVGALLDALVPELQRRFHDRGLIVQSGPSPHAKFPARHPDVGDILIEENETDFIVYFGNHTHCHYGVVNPKSLEGLADAVNEVVEMLAALFEERLKIWSDRRSGGVVPVGYDGIKLFGRFRILKPRGRQYVWSGPVRPVDKKDSSDAPTPPEL